MVVKRLQLEVGHCRALDAGAKNGRMAATVAMVKLLRVFEEFLSFGTVFVRERLWLYGSERASGEKKLRTLGTRCGHGVEEGQEAYLQREKENAHITSQHVGSFCR